MYILFINPGGKRDIFFSAQNNNNSNKKNCPTYGFNRTQPNPCRLGWTHVIGWIGLNFFWPTMVGWVKKSPQPDPCTPLLFCSFFSSFFFSPWCHFFSHFFFPFLTPVSLLLSFLLSFSFLLSLASTTKNHGGSGGVEGFFIFFIFWR